MKKLLLTLLMLLIATVVSAETFTTPAPNVFTDGQDFVITLMPPSNTAAVQGDIVLNNCTFVSISETYADKEIAYNPANGRFVLYGLNDTPIAGGEIIITVTPSSNASIDIGIASPLGATEDAQPVSIDVFSHVAYSNLDINGDGTFDSADILAYIQEIFAGNGDVVGLMTLIKAYLLE